MSESKNAPKATGGLFLSLGKLSSPAKGSTFVTEAKKKGDGGGFPVGTISVWASGTYQKQHDGSWDKVAEKKILSGAPKQNYAPGSSLPPDLAHLSFDPLKNKKGDAPAAKTSAGAEPDLLTPNATSAVAAPVAAAPVATVPVAKPEAPAIKLPASLPAPFNPDDHDAEDVPLEFHLWGVKVANAICPSILGVDSVPSTMIQTLKGRPDVVDALAGKYGSDWFAKYADAYMLFKFKGKEPAKLAKSASQDSWNSATFSPNWLSDLKKLQGGAALGSVGCAPVKKPEVAVSPAPPTKASVPKAQPIPTPPVEAPVEIPAAVMVGVHSVTVEIASDAMNTLGFGTEERRLFSWLVANNGDMDLAIKALAAEGVPQKHASEALAKVVATALAKNALYVIPGGNGRLALTVWDDQFKKHFKKILDIHSVSVAEIAGPGFDFPKKVLSDVLGPDWKARADLLKLTVVPTKKKPLDPVTSAYWGLTDAEKAGVNAAIATAGITDPEASAGVAMFAAFSGDTEKIKTQLQSDFLYSPEEASKFVNGLMYKLVGASLVTGLGGKKYLTPIVKPYGQNFTANTLHQAVKGYGKPVTGLFAALDQELAAYADPKAAFDASYGSDPDVDKIGVKHFGPNWKDEYKKLKKWTDVPVAGFLFPNVNTLKNQGSVQKKMGGNKPKYLLTNPVNPSEQYLFKSVEGSKTRAFAGQAAAQLANMVLGTSGAMEFVPVKAVTHKDLGFGTIQPILPNEGVLTDEGLTLLQPDQIRSLLRERVIDWVIANHDSKAGNFLKLPNGEIVGIDKEQAFKLIGSDKLSLDYKPNPSPPIYNALFHKWVANEIDLDPNAMLPYIETVENILPDDWIAAVQPYIDAMHAESGKSKMLLADAILQRKHSVRKDFEIFFTSLMKKKGVLPLTGQWKFGDPVPDKLPEPAKPEKLTIHPSDAQDLHKKILAITGVEPGTPVSTALIYLVSNSIEPSGMAKFVALSHGIPLTQAETASNTAISLAVGNGIVTSSGQLDLDAINSKGATATAGGLTDENEIDSVLSLAEITASDYPIAKLSHAIIRALINDPNNLAAAKILAQVDSSEAAAVEHVAEMFNLLSKIGILKATAGGQTTVNPEYVARAKAFEAARQKLGYASPSPKSAALAFLLQDPDDLGKAQASLEKLGHTFIGNTLTQVYNDAEKAGIFQSKKVDGKIVGTEINLPAGGVASQEALSAAAKLIGIGGTGSGLPADIALKHLVQNPGNIQVAIDAVTSAGYPAEVGVQAANNVLNALKKANALAYTGSQVSLNLAVLFPNGVPGSKALDPSSLEQLTKKIMDDIGFNTGLWGQSVVKAFLSTPAGFTPLKIIDAVVAANPGMEAAQVQNLVADIFAAMAKKGYLKPDPQTGQWSVDASKLPELKPAGSPADPHNLLGPDADIPAIAQVVASKLGYFMGSAAENMIKALLGDLGSLSIGSLKPMYNAPAAIAKVSNPESLAVSVWKKLKDQGFVVEAPNGAWAFSPKAELVSTLATLKKTPSAEPEPFSPVPPPLNAPGSIPLNKLPGAPSYLSLKQTLKWKETKKVDNKVVALKYIVKYTDYATALKAFKADNPSASYTTVSGFQGNLITAFNALKNNKLADVQGYGILAKILSWGPPKAIPGISVLNTPVAPPVVPPKPKKAKGDPLSNLPAIPNLPAISSLTPSDSAVAKAIKGQGAGDKEVLKDSAGNEFIFKFATKKGTKEPQPFRVAGQVAVSALALKLKPFHVSVGPGSMNGLPGTLQNVLKLGSPAEIGKNYDPAKLTEQEKEDVASEHLIDWVTSQHDSHGSNLMRTADGRIVGIDKEQAFKYFYDKSTGKFDADKLDIDYHPNSAYGETEPYYNKFWRSFAEGKVDFDPQKLAPYFDKLKEIDGDQYGSMIEPYAALAFPGALAKQAVFVQAAKNRKFTARAEFEKFITDLYVKREGVKGSFTFKGGWVPAGGKVQEPTKKAEPVAPPEKIKVKKKLVDLLPPNASESFISGLKVSPHQPKKEPADPTLVTLKLPHGNDKAVLEKFIADHGLTLVGNVVTGSNYHLAVVKKEGLNKEVEKEVPNPDYHQFIQAQNQAKYGAAHKAPPKIPPHPQVATYLPAIGLEASVPNAEELDSVQTSKSLGVGGKMFMLGGSAVESQALKIKRIISKKGQEEFFVTFKLRPPLLNELCGDMHHPTFPAGGTPDTFKLPQGAYDPVKDAIVETATISFTPASRSFVSGKNSIHIANAGYHQNYALMGAVYSRISLEKGESLKEVLGNLLNAIKPGLADKILTNPTDEERKIKKLAALLAAEAPQVADKLQPHEYTVEALTAKLNKAGVADAEDVIEIEGAPGQTTTAIPGRWKELATNPAGQPALKALVYGVNTPTNIANMFVNKMVSGNHERLITGVSADVGASTGATSGSVGTSADIQTGGSDVLQTRVVTEKHLGKFLNSIHSGVGAGAPYKIVMVPDVLDRLDAHFNTSDKYGVTNPEHGSYGSSYRARKPLTKALSGYYTGDYGESSHELCLKRAVGTNKVACVAAVDEAHRAALVAAMKERGLNEINGVPVEEFVLGTQNVTTVVTQFLKPLGY